jgi:CDP-diacylglycerol---glycerol-3-phosphate 3-phosphatidyltransferase
MSVPSLWSLPNLLSFSRIVAAPILYVLIAWPDRYGFTLALVVFVLASLSDTADGELARRRGQVSPFGVYLDTTADKILVAVLLIVLVSVHAVPAWMAAVIIAREFLVTGLRSYAAALGIVISAGGWGKAKTAITIGALLLVLLAGDAMRGGLLSSQWGLVDTLLLRHYGPYTIPIWSLLLATIWTVGSGAEYIREALPMLTHRPVTPARRRADRQPVD